MSDSQQQDRQYREAIEAFGAPLARLARAYEAGGRPADALVFKSPGATALNRTFENRLKLFAKNASDESSAALIGAM